MSLSKNTFDVPLEQRPQGGKSPLECVAALLYGAVDDSALLNMIRAVVALAAQNEPLPCECCERPTLESESAEVGFGENIVLDVVDGAYVLGTVCKACALIEAVYESRERDGGAWDARVSELQDSMTEEDFIRYQDNQDAQGYYRPPLRLY